MGKNKRKNVDSPKTLKKSARRTAILPKSLMFEFVFPIIIRLLWFHYYCISISRILL